MFDGRYSFEIVTYYGHTNFETLQGSSVMKRDNFTISHMGSRPERSYFT